MSSLPSGLSTKLNFHLHPVQTMAHDKPAFEANKQALLCGKHIIMYARRDLELH